MTRVPAAEAPTGAALRDSPAVAAALARIKPEVRAQQAYTLTAPAAARKLNQNESPFDAPDAVKDAVLAAARTAPWNRYPPYSPAELLERIARRHGWTPDGVLVGNGSNELIQATLAVTGGHGTPVVTPGPTFTPHRRLVVLRTFSKAMSLAGLRFGYALAHPAVAAEIVKAKLPYNVSRLTLAAAHAALDAAPVLEERTRAVRESRDLLCQRLRAIPGLLAYPSAANFVLVRCLARPGSEVFHRLAAEHGIVVRDVSRGGPGLENCLRITAGTPQGLDAGAAAPAAVPG